MIIYLFQLFGLHNMFVHVFGVYLIHKAVRLPYDPYLAFLFKCWLCFATETCLIHAVKAVFSLRLMAKVEDCSGNSLLSGIERYNLDMHWNVVWNKIQHSYSCCGVTGYKDWVNIVWRSSVEERYFVRCVIDDIHKMCNHLNITYSLKGANTTLVPSSCCAQSALCDIVLPEMFTNTSLLELSDHTENIVNKNGCLQPLIWKTTTIFQLVAILCSVQVIIQVSSMIYVT